MNIGANIVKKSGEYRVTARLAVAAVLLAATAVLPGCAAVALSAVGPAAEFGIENATSGTTAKTYTASLHELRLAALKSLSRMEMDVTADGGDETEWEIEAEAADSTIEVELESLTPKTTRVEVSAGDGLPFFRDDATAQEVVAQISEALRQDMQVAGDAVLVSQGGTQ